MGGGERKKSEKVYYTGNGRKKARGKIKRDWGKKAGRKKAKTTRKGA